MKKPARPEPLPPASPKLELNARVDLHLHNIAFGGALKKYTPPEHAERLIQAGHVRQAVGGLMITEDGHDELMRQMTGDIG